MKKLILAAAIASLAFAGEANATLLATFGQTELTNTVVATDNGTTTHIAVTNSDAGITSFLGGGLSNAFFDLSANSVDAVIAVGSALIQHYNGTFCFTSLAGCAGTNYLSGTFTDAAFGASGGPGLVLNVNSPPDTLDLTSSVISASLLVAPSSFNLGFTNLGPALHTDGTTLGAFTASYAGNVSASATAVPEPATLTLMSLGLLGLGFIQCKRNGA